MIEETHQDRNDVIVITSSSHRYNNIRWSVFEVEVEVERRDGGIGLQN